MNTFGLGKGITRFWLNLPYGGVIYEGWKEIVRFTLYLKRIINFNLER